MTGHGRGLLGGEVQIEDDLRAGAEFTIAPENRAGFESESLLTRIASG
jgi:hypothetical protein